MSTPLLAIRLAIKYAASEPFPYIVLPTSQSLGLVPTLPADMQDPSAFNYLVTGRVGGVEPLLATNFSS